MSRPSPTGEEGDHELLAQVRRRLPPEVDVVELEMGPGDEEDAVRGLGKAGVPLLAGAVALSGCAPSADEIRSATAGTKSEVLEVSRDVLAALTPLGAPYGPVEGRWRSCRDKAGWLQYYVVGRIDPRPEDEVDRPLVDRVPAAMDDAGYSLHVVDESSLGVRTMQAVTGDVNVQVTGYTTDPFLLLDISGVCIEVADLDEEFRYEPATTLP